MLLLLSADSDSLAKATKEIRYDKFFLLILKNSMYSELQKMCSIFNKN